MTREYILSKDQKHRLKLKYTWDSSKPTIMFIMLNPSYMRAEGDLSPTSKVIIQYAKDNGYGSLFIGNLFSYITPNPQNIITSGVSVFIENDIALRQMASESKEIIFAWGSYEFAIKRGESIVEMFPNGYALYYNRDGSPAHPLSKNFLYEPFKN